MLQLLNICTGNSDKHFVSMIKANKNEIRGRNGAVTAYLDTKMNVTIRSSNCEILLSNSEKCSQCINNRNSLQSIYHRWHIRQKASPSKRSSTFSHINERWLSTPQRKHKMSRLKARMRASERRCKSLQEKIQESIDKSGIEVDDSLHDGLKQPSQ
jgi:hypothetical protein